MAAAIGVLLVNLGTPDSPSVGDVRRYLREFLCDRRVVDAPRLLWRPLLELVILPLRAPKSARAYAQVWSQDGSPLLATSRRQAQSLARELGETHAVELSMRYGSPSIEAGVRALVALGCERIVLLSMFPQYCNATVGSIQAEVARVVSALRAQPAVAVVPPWFEDQGYLDALRDACLASLAGRGKVSHWVISFHGVPERYVRLGDPYRDQCERTAAALAERLGLSATEWTLAYQSRFGREKWLEPCVAELVPGLARAHPRLGIVTPGFTTDCLETLEEIGLRLRADFEHAGGTDLVVVPCLNDSPALITTLARRVRAMGG